MSAYTTRPLSDRAWLRPAQKRTHSPFSSTWSKTLVLLEREVVALDGRYLVIGVDVSEKDLRLDGTLRARARAETPAVEVAFDSKHGPMLYRCDRYIASHGYGGYGLDWQENVRAIAKTLEALRAVDRYSASSSGEQYRGYQQIAAFAAVDVQGPREQLAKIAGIELSDESDKALIAHARRAAHPDRGGSAAAWHAVEELASALAGGDR